MNADVESRVLDIVARQSGKDRSAMTADTTLQELDVDSLEGIEIVFEVEESFGIQLSNDEAPGKQDSLRKLVDAVQAALARTGSAAGSAHAA